MHDVLILSLSAATRVPVLRCADELHAAGARVHTESSTDDQELDASLARLDGPPREDGLIWPDPSGKTRLIVAVESLGQLRHVVRRMARRYTPPPSRRPAELPQSRTMPDLPPLGLLPLTELVLVRELALPQTPAEVAAATIGGTPYRLDLVRNDGGSVTLDGVLATAAPQGDWHGRVIVDDAVLSDGSEPILVLGVANAGGAAEFDGLPLNPAADPADGVLDVALAVRAGNNRALRFEVRRARGRAVAITPAEPSTEVPIWDDGVTGTLSRKRSWWIEPGAWSVYTAPGRDVTKR